MSVSLRGTRHGRPGRVVLAERKLINLCSALSHHPLSPAATQQPSANAPSRAGLRSGMGVCRGRAAAAWYLMEAREELWGFPFILHNSKLTYALFALSPTMWIHAVEGN